MMSTLGPFESQVEWGILRGHSRRRHVEWDVEWGKSNALSTCKSNGAVGATRSGPPGGAAQGCVAANLSKSLRYLDVAATAVDADLALKVVRDGLAKLQQPPYNLEA